MEGILHAIDFRRFFKLVEVILAVECPWKVFFNLEELEKDPAISSSYRNIYTVIIQKIHYCRTV